MAAGERIFALEEESAGQFEARAHQAGPDREHAPQGGDGGVEEGVARLLVEALPARRREAGLADQEQQGKIVGPRFHGRLEDFQRLDRPPGPQ